LSDKTKIRAGRELTGAWVAAFVRLVSRPLRVLFFTFLVFAAPAAAQEAVRGFVSVEPFEFRLEALVKVSAYRESWGMNGDSIDPGEKQAVLDNLLTLFESGVNLTIPGKQLAFTERTLRFIVPNPEKGFVPDERESIPIEEALVGLTLSSSMSGVTAFDLEWLWFAPGQERLVLEIASRGKPSARLLTPGENKASWKLDGEAVVPSLQPVPGLKTESSRPFRSLVFLGLLMFVVAAVVVVRYKTKSPAWVGWLIVGGLGVGIFALRYEKSRVILPADAAAEDLVYALLRNTYHAFDFRDESAIYDTLEKSVSGPLLEEVYLEMRSFLELENTGGPRVRVYEIALRECQEVPGGDLATGGFRTRAEWVTIGEVTHWGHTHERTNRYEAEIALVALDETWKISGLELLNEERIQKVSRQVIEPVAPPAPPPGPGPAQEGSSAPKPVP
jgi:hypothetical protein